MCRVKLYWMTAAVDTQSRRAVIEFKNTYSTQPEAFICRYLLDNFDNISM